MLRLWSRRDHHHHRVHLLIIDVMLDRGSALGRYGMYLKSSPGYEDAQDDAVEPDPGS